MARPDDDGNRAGAPAVVVRVRLAVWDPRFGPVERPVRDDRRCVGWLVFTVYGGAVSHRIGRVRTALFVGTYVMALCIVSIIAVTMVKETRGTDLARHRPDPVRGYASVKLGIIATLWE